MHNSTTILQTKRFIVSSLSKFSRVSDSIDYLSYIGRQAFYAREFDLLLNTGESLKGLSQKSEATGQYFSALALTNQSHANWVQTKAIYEQLADCQLPKIRAASLVSLGGFDLSEGKFNQATQNLYLEASRIALRHKSLLIFAEAQSALSLICSINSNHKEALELLRGIIPAVLKMAQHFPACGCFKFIRLRITFCWRTPSSGKDYHTSYRFAIRQGLSNLA
jgi:hypothetical protein